ncbi:hypothetical protein [Nocardioides lijunqiniae]|uniref:hypothetical protein n=1 Tax=Nocardioides lijunqiniae TaxID=2760832 RepID=UPI001877A15D|nr:hypothetical protein [Nocardioides lijunqiniae]
MSTSHAQRLTESVGHRYDLIERMVVAVLGTALGLGALWYGFEVFRDETQTQAVMWLRIAALALGLMAYLSVIASYFLIQRESDLLKLRLLYDAEKNNHDENMARHVDELESAVRFLLEDSRRRDDA